MSEIAEKPISAEKSAKNEEIQAKNEENRAKKEENPVKKEEKSSAVDEKAKGVTEPSTTPKKERKSSSPGSKSPKRSPPQNPQPQRPRRGSSKSFSQSGGTSNQPHYQPAPFYYQNNYRGGGYYQQQQNAWGNQQHHQPWGNQPPNSFQQRRHFSDGAGKKFRRHSAANVLKNVDASNPNSAKVSAKSSDSRQRSSRSESGGANGELDYYPDDEFDLEEPFSESDEDENLLTTKIKRQVLSLPMPRRRIRTLSGMIPPVGYAPTWAGPTMCLNCFEFYDLSNQTVEYVKHLLDTHRIVVSEIDLIVDLKRYIEYWRHRFGEEPIEKTFPEITPKDGDALFGKVEKYFLMSEKVPEDRKIRERLAMRRLEEVLSCQQREREDRTFSRQCLFCRYQAKGNRSKLIHHLYMIHHLNLGSPDNLVFVTEYLDVLQGKLQKGECIYCEKQFPDHATLMEHMRKKGHREVNPNNNYYDKFYVINYLELGKKWVEVLAEDFEDSMPTFVDSEEEEEEETWNEWQEDNIEEEEMTIVCLFCDESFSEADKLLSHIKDAHQFDLRKIVKEFKMNFYDRVKFINFIRKLSHNCICFVCGKDDLHSWQALRKHLSEGDHLTKTPLREKWEAEEFLIPTYENDSFLCVLDEFDEEDPTTTLSDPAILDNGPVDSSPDSVIFAEDAPDLSDTVLNDVELREQLK